MNTKININMTQEEKQLLLQDLCARLPYGVIYHCNYGANIRLKEIDINRGYFNYTDNIEEMECKPYLRPMSSMTEKELKEFSYTVLQQPDLDVVRSWQTLSIDLKELPKVLDWLNKNMFDYRGLIPMRLAIEAPKDMYDTKTE